MTRLVALAAVAAALMFSGCAGGVAPTATQTASRPSLASPSPSSTPSGPVTYQIGETIELPSANIVVEVIEGTSEIPRFYHEPYTPKAGERLWFVKMRWTNNSAEAVKKECFGPYTMDLRAFDLDGREMLEVDQPGTIEGNECSTGLMQGQEGAWLTAFRSLDSEFGWLQFEDYEGGRAAVVADPSLKPKVK